MSAPPSRLEAHIRRTLELRYPSHIVTNDALGRDRLRALLDTIAIQGNVRKLQNIIAGWAPFLDGAAADHLADRCMTAPRRWSSTELGILFDLTEEERAAIGAWNIRPAGYTDADMERLRRETKAKSSCRSRRRKAKDARAKSKAAADDDGLKEHEKDIYLQTTDVWRSSTEISSALTRWPKYRPLKKDALRQMIHRGIKRLADDGWIEREKRDGLRRQEVTVVRRAR